MKSFQLTETDYDGTGAGKDFRNRWILSSAWNSEKVIVRWQQSVAVCSKSNEGRWQGDE